VFMCVCAVCVQTDVKAWGGKKMMAFADSMFGKPEVTEEMGKCVDIVRGMQREEKTREELKEERIAWIRTRQVRGHGADLLEGDTQGCRVGVECGEWTTALALTRVACANPCDSQGDDKYMRYYYEEDVRAHRRHFISKLTAQIGYTKDTAKRVISVRRAA
jgi:hypothetical protein